jgi:hypothetical protein
VFESEVWFQKSQTDGLSGDDAAFGFNLVMPNSNKWRGGIGFKELQQNFEPRLGFANRTGIRNFYTAVGYTHRPQDSAIRTLRTGFNYRRFDRIDGSTDTEVLFISLAALENHHGDTLVFSRFFSTQGLTDPFEISTGVIIPTGRYDYGGWGLNLGTGNQRKLRGAFEIRTGGFFSGDQLRIGGGFTWRPSRFYNVTARYQFQDSDLPEGDFITRLVTLQNEIVFSSKWAWVTLAQYDNVSNNLGIHSRLHWIPVEGREMFVVLNHNFIEEDNEFRSTDSQFVIKLGYTFRF